MEHSINRHGLTEVFKPADTSTVDIVFVHGINGHPYGTWTSENDRTFWPAELLPPFIEEAKARVLVYGYDADTNNLALIPNDKPKSSMPYNEASQDRIHNHAEHLVATLCANRRVRHATHHPIVFVAHSLGGIVVKRALIYSSGKRGQHTEHLRSIAVSTHGILFLGTPHFGYDRAKWSTWSDNVTRVTLERGLHGRLMGALKPNSETLQNIERQFVELASDYHIYYFHEMMPTKLDNGWQFLVDEPSAAPVIRDVERAGIQRDHSHMCVFENKDSPGFTLVVDAIQRYAAEAFEPIRRRWVIESDEKHRRLLAGISSGVENISIKSPAFQGSDAQSVGSNAATATMKIKEQQLKKHYLVPGDRVKHFVGRAAQLEEIASCLADPSSQQPRVLVLHALGGQGKSQIVLEYCQRWQTHYRGVFWVNASSRSLAIESYHRISRALSSPTQAHGENGEQVIETVKAELEDWREPWLLIFDNYDTPDDYRDIRRFFPQGKHGHVIITSRRRDLDRLGTLIELCALSPEEGVNLLLRGYSPQEIDENLEIAKEIVWRLGGLALAIDQAGAYIAHRRIPPSKLGNFLEIFETQRKEILSYTPTSVWEYGSMQNGREEDHTKAINAFTTWEISLKELIRIKPQEKEAIIHFLRLSAYFNPARIDESLFRNYWVEVQKRKEPSKEVPPERTRWRQIFKSNKKRKPRESNVNNKRTQWLYAMAVRSRHKNDIEQEGSWCQRSEDQWDPDRFWDLLQILHNLSLVQSIETNIEGASFSLHPLVRDWLLHRNQLGDHQHYMDEAFAVVVSNVLVRDQGFRSLGIDQRVALLSHLDLCMLNDELLSEPQSRLGNGERTYETASKSAYFYRFLGRYDTAEVLLRRITENVDADIEYFTQLSRVLVDQGEFEQAVEMRYQCWEYREKALEERNPKRLRFETALSNALVQSGRYNEAEPIQRQTLQLKQETLGNTCRETVESMCDLAYSLYLQGKSEEAETLAREALELCETHLSGNDGPRLKTDMLQQILALALQGQGRIDEAEVIQRKVLQIRQHLLGMEHPYTANAMLSLALILELTNKDEAEELYRYAVQTMKKVLRKGHPYTLGSMEGLAKLLRKDGRVKEADEIEREVSDLKKAAQSGAHRRDLHSAIQMRGTL
ncbi:MAG: hypothetical protein Q9192_005376 [Flavoplaca navasiana]